MRERREQCHTKTWHWTFRSFKTQDSLIATETTFKNVKFEDIEHVVCLFQDIDQSVQLRLLFIFWIIIFSCGITTCNGV